MIVTVKTRMKVTETIRKKKYVLCLCVFVYKKSLLGLFFCSKSSGIYRDSKRHRRHKKLISFWKLQRNSEITF